jgi:hypothetical protein
MCGLFSKTCTPYPFLHLSFHHHLPCRLYLQSPSAVLKQTKIIEKRERKGHFAAFCLLIYLIHGSIWKDCVSLFYWVIYLCGMAFPFWFLQWKLCCHLLRIPPLPCSGSNLLLAVHWRAGEIGQNVSRRYMLLY